MGFIDENPISSQGQEMQIQWQDMIAQKENVYLYLYM